MEILDFIGCTAMTGIIIFVIYAFLKGVFKKSAAFYLEDDDHNPYSLYVSFWRKKDVDACLHIMRNQPLTISDNSVCIVEHRTARLELHSIGRISDERFRDSIPLLVMQLGKEIQENLDRKKEFVNKTHCI